MGELNRGSGLQHGLGHGPAPLLPKPWLTVRFWITTAFLGVSVSPPANCTAGVPVVLNPGQALEPPGKCLENTDDWSQHGPIVLEPLGDCGVDPGWRCFSKFPKQTLVQSWG